MSWAYIILYYPLKNNTISQNIVTLAQGARLKSLASFSSKCFIYVTAIHMAIFLWYLYTNK